MLSRSSLSWSSAHKRITRFALLAAVIVLAKNGFIEISNGAALDTIAAAKRRSELAPPKTECLSSSTQSAAFNQQDVSPAASDNPSFPATSDHFPVTVPFEFKANFIVVSVRLNGSRERYSLMADTGAVNFLAPEVAKKLGLTPSGQYFSYGAGSRTLTGGTIKAGSVSIGKLTLHNQKFFVVEIPYALQHGFHPEIVGGIGYEFLRTLPFRVDYVQKSLTFYRTADDLPKHSGQVAVPFVLRGMVPLVPARIEGIPGQFEIDSGSDRALSLFAPFVAQHHLVEFYSSPLSGFAGEGVGGREVAYFVRTRTLEIGSGIVLHGMTADLLQDTAGIGADPEISGNIGTTILKRFTTTFDYSHQQIYFERNGSPDRPDIFNRSGMALRITPEGLKVMTVFAQGPAAAAGIEPGDTVLRVAGRSGSRLDAPFLIAIFRRPAGSVLHLRILHHGKERDLALTLRDLLS